MNGEESHLSDGHISDGLRAIIELAARRAAAEAIETADARIAAHESHCDGRKQAEAAHDRLDKHDNRIKVIELSRAKLLGICLGAGLAGGGGYGVIASVFKSMGGG